MELSIIIPTYNGAHKVPNILRALEGQTYKSFEVVMVVDGSTDATEQIVNPQGYSFPVKIINQENKGRSGARNTGVNNSRGGLFIFFDDDVRPSSQCVEMHWKHHIEYPGTIMVGGIFEESACMKTDIQKYRAYLSEKWTKKIAFSEGSVSEQIYLSAANMSLSSSLFKELGGFDERLRDVEDYDLGIRAWLTEIPVYVKSDAFVWHDDFITIQSYIGRLREYQRANQMLLKMKPEYARLNILASPIKYYSIKKIFYFIFTYFDYIVLIEKSKLNFLPKKWRYKIYDYVITAYSVYFPSKNT